MMGRPLVALRQQLNDEALKELLDSSPTAAVFGHADGDGYVAAEQSRLNLELAGAQVADVVVDPKGTRNYRFWGGQLQEWDFSRVEFVLFVDIMLERKNPQGSVDAISYVASKFDETTFLVIDHHPVSGLKWMEPNLQFTFVDEAYDCCFGKPSDLMILASLCEKETPPAHAVWSEQQVNMAAGLKRAAADHGRMAGNALVKLLRHQRWDTIATIGSEPTDMHYSFYGRRRSSVRPSPALEAAFELSTSL